MNRLHALELLYECTGDDLWSREYCLQRGVPESWIEELVDAFESGYRSESQMIYVGNRRVNQYEGVRDLDLAIRIGEYLGVDTSSIVASHLTRASIVRAIREHIEDE